MSHDLPRRRQASQKLAKELRSHLTSAEKLLWSLVRAKRLGGLKFHRQFPIGPYIADYYCPAKKLIVELDGESHDFTIVQDLKRTEYLQEQGLQILRISNDDVMSSLEVVGILILETAGCDPRPWLAGECRKAPSP